MAEGARDQGRGIEGMGPRAAAWLAWSLCAVSLSLLAPTLLMAILSWSTPLPKGWISWQGQLIAAAGSVGAPILGGLVASRRPQNPYGWLWLGLGLGLALVTFAQVYAAYALVAEPGSLPAPRTVGSVVAGIGWSVWLTLTPLLLLLFPDGRPPSRRWRFLVWIVTATGAVLLIVGRFVPGQSGLAPVENPFGVGGVVGEAIAFITDAVVYALFVAIFLSASSLVFRYRRAGGVERQQIKWFAFTAVLFVGVGFVLIFYDPPGAWDALVEIVTVASLYVAVGVAVLKYRLYDIDVVINRTLVYAHHLAGDGVLRRRGDDGGDLPRPHRPRAAAATRRRGLHLSDSCPVQPLRRRIQGFIDRRFSRRKYDAAKTLEAFSAKLREEPNLDALSEDLVGVVRETMQPAHVGLWLRPDSSLKGGDGTTDEQRG